MLKFIAVAFVHKLLLTRKLLKVNIFVRSKPIVMSYNIDVDILFITGVYCYSF